MRSFETQKGKLTKSRNSSSGKNNQDLLFHREIKCLSFNDVHAKEKKK